MHVFDSFTATRFKTAQYGRKWNVGARDEALPPPSPVTGRLMRAQANFEETFPIAIVALLGVVLANRTSVVDALPQIAVPTLVITGTEDKAFPRFHGEELARHIPEAQLEVLQAVGHMAPREAPSAVAALLAQFLA